MQFPSLERLDEIEEFNPDPNTGQELEALELMEAFAQGVEELDVLIERYGSSRAPIIAQSLACLLATRAPKPSQEMAEHVAKFVTRFSIWDHGESVMNALTAVQHTLHYVDASASETLRRFSPFLRMCLNYSGRHWVIIKAHALALLPILRNRELLNKVFTDGEFLELREMIRELQATAGEELHDELLSVADFMGA